MAEVSAVIFEGGTAAANRIQEAMINMRKLVVLDNLEKMRNTPGIDRVILCTSYPDLASEAAGMGVEVDPAGDTDRPFHFGERLAEVIAAFKLEKVLYLGGAGAPLITTSDLAWIAGCLREKENIVIMNNAQSADLVAFSPASVVHRLELPSSDNFLGYLLREAGLERVLPENTPRINFDLDTPTDFLLLSLLPGVGPRVSIGLKALDWDRSRLLLARETLKKPWVEITLVGRVGAPLMSYLNQELKCRLRVFSEERGMKALGREERGEVTSLLGYLVRDIGPERFFRYVASMSDVAFVDTRVIFAHLKGKVDEWDRYHSDLGHYDLIRDDLVRRFTRAAVAAPIPVVLGGHSLVAGGLWLLAEHVLQELSGNKQD